MGATNGTMTGVGRFDMGVGAAPAGVTWSPTDVGSTLNFTFTNGNLTVERTSNAGGAVNMCGRATAYAPALSAAFSVVFNIDVQSGFQTVGLSNSSMVMSGAYLGQNGNGIGYANTGEINFGGASHTTSVSTYTTGDIITMNVNLAANTVEFLKNGVPQGSPSARPLLAALNSVALACTYHAQTIGPKITANFTGHP